MKKLIIAAAIALTLPGCALLGSNTLRDQQLAVKFKYFVVTVPPEMMVIPDPVYKLDTTISTDKDAAYWIIDSEKRALELERRLKAIKSYVDRQVEETKKLPEADVIKR
jgi:hypothetical protein